MELHKEDGQCKQQNGLSHQEQLRKLVQGDNVRDDIHETKERAEEGPKLKDVAPDGGWGWFVMIGSLIVHMVIGGSERSSGLLYLKLLTFFGQSATATSWAVTTSSTLRFLLGPLASALCHIFAVRTVAAIGAALSTVGILLAAVSPNITFFFFVYGIMAGVGRALTFGPSLILVGQYFNKRRSFAAGVATSGAAIGSCVFPLFLEDLFTNCGFSGTILVLGAINSHLFITAALARPLELHRRITKQDRLNEGVLETTRMLHGCNTSGTITSGEIHKSGTLPNATSALLDKCESNKNSMQIEKLETLSTDQSGFLDKCESNKTSWIKKKLIQVKKSISGGKRKESNGRLLELPLLKNFAFLCLCLQLFLFTMARNTTFTYLPVLAAEKGMDPQHSAYILSVLGICDTFSRLITSFILDLERLRPFRLIIYNAIIFVVASVTLAMPLMSTFPQLFVVSGIFGVAVGLYISQKSVACVDVLGVENLTSSLGLLLAFQGTGSFISPTLGGLMKDIQGSYVVTFIVGAVGTFVGGAVMVAGNVWLYRRARGRYQILK